MDGIIITARLKSTRLLKKVTIKVEGKTILNYLIDRIKNQSDLPIYLCTSQEMEDDPLINLSNNLKINYFRGDAEDVLNRYYECMNFFNLENVYIVYADEPFIDIELLNLSFDQLKNSREPSWVRNDDYVDGVFGYGFNYSALKMVNNLKTSDNNEVWGKMVSKMPLKIIKNLCPYKVKKDKVRLTIDYKDDLDVFEKIILEIRDDYKFMKIEEIINVYNKLRLYQINLHRANDYNLRIKSQSI